MFHNPSGACERASSSSADNGPNLAAVLSGFFLVSPFICDVVIVSTYFAYCAARLLLLSRVFHCYCFYCSAGGVLLDEFNDAKEVVSELSGEYAAAESADYVERGGAPH